MLKPVHAFLAVSFALTCLAPASVGARSPAPVSIRAQAPAKDFDLKGELRKTVAWLRGTQDLKTGAYAGGVEGTAWVLAVLADCPDHYRRVDGPFVAKALEFLAARQDALGAIHDEKVTAGEVAAQNALAVMALGRHADAESKAVHAKAFAFAGQSAATPPATGIALPAEKDAMKKLANELLAKRGPDSAWDGPRGKVVESARTALALCEIYAKTSASSASSPAAAKPLPAFEAADRAKALAAVERGAQYLLSKSRNGIFDARPGDPSAGITAMAVGALQCVPEPRPAEMQKAIDNALQWLVSLQQKDGSIHDGQLANYTTSAAILAFARSKRAEYAPVIEKARTWLMALQADEAEGYSPDHPFYGGNSYGDEQRPDLSNVQFALEALAASGLEKGSESYKRALVFLQRCQNRSESNDIKMPDADGKTIVSGDDGGAGYGPGTSKAGFIDLGDGRKVSRSYGSMSYALLKGYILCGLPKDDPRMKACWDWLQKHYTLDVNPGFESSSDPSAPYQGLYYYLHTMAKTLALHGEETLVDAAGKAHAWRKELCGRLVAMQSKEDGSWVNANAGRWWESNGVMATSYALISLDAAMPK